MADEAGIKRLMVKRIKEEGGYGRRLEDSFAVGLPDLILIPKHGFVFLTEVKIIKGEAKFGCTPRQAEELRRVAETESYAIPVLIGHGPTTGRLYACKPRVETRASEAVCSEPKPWNISELLNRYAELMHYQQSLNSEGKHTATLPQSPTFPNQ